MSERDGRLVLVIFENERAATFGAADGSPVSSLTGSFASISPDGALAAAVRDDGSIDIVDLATELRVAVQTDTGKPLTSASFGATPGRDLRPGGRAADARPGDACGRVDVRPAAAAGGRRQLTRAPARADSRLPARGADASPADLPREERRLRVVEDDRLVAVEPARLPVDLRPHRLEAEGEGVVLQLALRAVEDIALPGQSPGGPGDVVGDVVVPRSDENLPVGAAVRDLTGWAAPGELVAGEIEEVVLGERHGTPSWWDGTPNLPRFRLVRKTRLRDVDTMCQITKRRSNCRGILTVVSEYAVALRQRVPRLRWKNGKAILPLLLPFVNVRRPVIDENVSKYESL
jgi:hypothetical protein